MSRKHCNTVHTPASYDWRLRRCVKEFRFDSWKQEHGSVQHSVPTNTQTPVSLDYTACDSESEVVATIVGIFTCCWMHSASFPTQNSEFISEWFMNFHLNFGNQLQHDWCLGMTQSGLTAPPRVTWTLSSSLTQCRHNCCFLFASGLPANKIISLSDRCIWSGKGVSACLLLLLRGSLGRAEPCLNECFQATKVNQGSVNRKIPSIRGWKKI